MAMDSQNCVVINGWTYYHFEAIDSVQHCREIAKTCRHQSLLNKVYSIVSISLGIFSLTPSYVAAKTSLQVFAIYNQALAGLIFSCPVLGIASIPFLLLSIVTARCWSYSQHLAKQAEKANLRLVNIQIESG